LLATLTDQSIHQRLRVAAIQLNATGDRARNLAEADRLTREAVADGARLVLLPEKWSVLGGPDVLLGGAEPLDGPALGWAREIASELRVDLVAGSIAERTSEGLANTCAHIAPDGEVRALYRKIHMFDVTVDGVVYEESRHEEAGSEIVTSQSAGGVPLGLSICYDLRFPELYRILALRGARILLVPAAFTYATTRDHWETLLRARAIENQAFVIAANQIGEHPPSYRSGGRSMIVDPWGVVLAQAPDEVCQITAPLDLAHLERIREQLPALANRRPAAYAWPQEVLAP
jgi:predicted amidohydrolase